MKVRIYGTCCLNGISAVTFVIGKDFVITLQCSCNLAKFAGNGSSNYQNLLR